MTTLAENQTETRPTTLSEKTVSHIIPLRHHIEMGDSKIIEREFRLTFLVERDHTPKINLSIDDISVPKDTDLNTVQNIDDIMTTMRIFSNGYDVNPEIVDDQILSLGADMVTQAKMPTRLFRDMIAQVILELTKKDSKIFSFIPDGYRFHSRITKNTDCGYDIYGYAVIFFDNKVFLTSYKSGNSTKWTLPFVRVRNGKSIEESLMKGIESRFNIPLNGMSGSIIVRGKNERNCLNFVYTEFLPDGFDINSAKTGRFFDMTDLPEGCISLVDTILENCFEEGKSFEIIDLHKKFKAEASN